MCVSNKTEEHQSDDPRFRTAACQNRRQLWTVGAFRRVDGEERLAKLHDTYDASHILQGYQTMSECNYHCGYTIRCSQFLHDVTHVEFNSLDGYPRYFGNFGIAFSI